MPKPRKPLVRRIVWVDALPSESVQYVELPEDFRSEQQKAADHRVAAATAREQHWLAWDEPWESDPTGWQRVAVMFQGTNQEEALRGLEGAGRIRNLRHEDGGGAPWRATSDRLPLPDSGLGVVQGVQVGPAEGDFRWSEPKTLAAWAELFDVHPNTVSTWLKSGKIRGKKVGKLWRIADFELP